MNKRKDCIFIQTNSRRITEHDLLVELLKESGWRVDHGAETVPELPYQKYTSLVRDEPKEETPKLIIPTTTPDQRHNPDRD